MGDRFEFDIEVKKPFVRRSQDQINKMRTEGAQDGGNCQDSNGQLQES
jgi:hypothetical protein